MQRAFLSSENCEVSNASVVTIAENGVQWLVVPGWEQLDWLWHGFSTRKGGTSRAYLLGTDDAESLSGELNLGFTAVDAPENVLENRLRFVKAVSGSRETPLALVRQIHSNCSLVADKRWMGSDSKADASAIPQADGLMTNQRGFLLGVQTADCIPVLVADPEKRAVAAFHAGWRGTVERIVEHGVERMREEFGSAPADLIAAIGPGIGPCCYTVGEEVRQRFWANFAYAEDLFTAQPGGGTRLDLIEANRRQLLSAGVAESSIALVGGCTSCQPEWFYSHRASGGRAGRMMAVIGIR